jgi:SAM-dependent methyltransferase
MHNASYNIMKDLIKQAQEYGFLFQDKETHVIDVGGQDVHTEKDLEYLTSTTYKKIFENNPLWHYTGLDMVPGKNVDIVAPTIPWLVPDNSYDLVISGQTLEHTKAPWLWVKEIERICKPNGLIIIIAPWKWDRHNYPIDCWRILPDGMTYLLAEWCNCEVLSIGMSEVDIIHGDCWGVARKK